VPIRRISKHVKDQNWFAVCIDLVVVFLAVFIGLQADSWNEERIADKTAKTYYTRLIGDLHAELRQRQARAVYYERTITHAEAALSSLQTSKQPLGKEFLIDAYQATQRWPYSAQRTTYDELVGVGIANAIPNAEIRSKLANVYINFEGSSITQNEPIPFRDRLRHEMLHEVQSTIREVCGDRFVFQENGQVYLELPEFCDVEMETSLVEEAVLALRAYDGFVKDLTHHIAILDTKLKSLRGYEQLISETIEILAAQ